MKLLIVCPVLLTTATLVAACGSGTPKAPATAPVALVELELATTRSVAETLTAYGTIEFSAADMITLSVQVESQVAELLVTSGEEVTSGQALLRLVPSPTTQLDVDKARRDAVAAAAERDRLRRLRADGLSTESELHAAASAAETAAEMRNSLNARIGDDGARTLRAPRTGIVDTLTVQPGDILVPGSVAVRIAAPDALQVRLGVEPSDASRIAVGQLVQLAALTPGAAAVATQIAGVDRRVDPITRLIAALVRLPRGSGLLPGAAVRAEVVVAHHDNAIGVPREALLYDGEQAYLFVVQDNVAQRRTVKTGVHDGDIVEVVDGLRAGESVVIAGGAVLKDGMATRTRSGGAAPVVVDPDK